MYANSEFDALLSSLKINGWENKTNYSAKSPLCFQELCIACWLSTGSSRSSCALSERAARLQRLFVFEYIVQTWDIDGKNTCMIIKRLGLGLYDKSTVSNCNQTFEFAFHNPVKCSNEENSWKYFSNQFILMRHADKDFPRAKVKLHL